MPDIAVIGASGYLGGLISARLAAEGVDFLRVTSRQQDVAAENTLVWTYGMAPPAGLSEARIWINCAFRLGAGHANLTLLRHLVQARGDQRLVQVSTNAVLAHPTGASARPFQTRWGGEDYARIKRAIDQYLISAVPGTHLRIVYPTAIIGENSNWDRALAAMAAHPEVRLPKAGAVQAAWVDSQDAVTQILETARAPEGETPAGRGAWQRTLQSTPARNWADLVRLAAPEGGAPPIVGLSTGRQFFDSRVMDLAFQVFCHPMLPDRVALPLFGVLRKRAGGARPSGPADPTAPPPAVPFTVTGPTRFYMAQDAGPGA